VASVDPTALREEIATLGKLIDKAKRLEAGEVETKLTKLREVITEQGVFNDTNMKLLIFTEHKETLDYLVEKLEDWGLTVTQIHGGMKIGDRDTPNTRIWAERVFKEECQVMVATEAAGEGINLQFCWFMINYDIPWNPMRLEQRMGRIHRYKQEKDCLIINFVSTNTREGRVLGKLFERIEEIEKDLDPKQTGTVFNVLGEVFPSNLLEKMLREMYSRNKSEKVITDRIVKDVDTERFRQITHSTLEGLAKRELNLSVIIGRREEAKERRLVPEVVEDFFLHAGPLNGIKPRPARNDSHVYRIGRVPRHLWTTGDRLELKFGKLGKEYASIVFDQKYLQDDPTLDWVTPGHPLFEVVRESLLETTQADLQHGAIFHDINRDSPVRLDVYTAGIRDGRGNLLHQRLFVVETAMDGTMSMRQPTIFLDVVPAKNAANPPDDSVLPSRAQVEQTLIEQALQPLLEKVTNEREKETATIKNHVEISLNELIDIEQKRFAELYERQQQGDTSQGLSQSLKNSEERLDILNQRLDQRRAELENERNCTIADIRHVGRAWVLPHPERKSSEIAPMVRNDEIERLAVEAVTRHEEARGRQVESVERENRGFDLISRRPHPEDPQTAIEVRFIEVKGRAGVNDVALTTNEYKTAERLKHDYWLYVVFNCATKPEIHIVQDPVRLGWKPVVKVEQYHVGPNQILSAAH